HRRRHRRHPAQPDRRAGARPAPRAPARSRAAVPRCDGAMKFGVTVFLSDRSIGPAEAAREAEARGFTSMYIPEHTHIPVSRRTPAPMGEPLPEYYWHTLDPFVALTAAAAATERLRLATAVLLV